MSQWRLGWYTVCFYVLLVVGCGGKTSLLTAWCQIFPLWNTMAPKSPSYSSTACIKEISLPFPSVWEADTCCGGRIAHSCGRTTGSTTCIFVGEKIYVLGNFLTGARNLTAGGFPVKFKIQDSSCCKTRAFSAYNVHPAVQPNINFFLGSLNGRHLEKLEIDEIENLWSFPFPRSFGMFGIKEDAAYLFYPFLCSVYLPLQEG